MRRALTYVAMTVLAVFALVCASGCATGVAAVTSAWPEADSERRVEQPPDLLRWPLTGLPASDAAETEVRVVSVKVENSPAARPQSNLDKADIVYESLTEGDVTRFNAFYHSQAPEEVGPVRSARLSDVYLVPQYGALFAHAGGNSQVISRLRGAGIDDMDEFANSGPYTRSSSRRMPHNLYVDVTALREAAEAKGYDGVRTVPPLAFDIASAPTTPTIVKFTVPFGNGNDVVWTYDPDANRYMRAHRSTSHYDKVSEEQYGADNVVVMWAKTSYSSRRDVTGARTLDIELSGSGRVTVFRDGQKYDGTWHAADGSPPAFEAEDGTPILLTRGNTWIEVVRPSTMITME